jgi:spore germination protein GerM
MIRRPIDRPARRGTRRAGGALAVATLASVLIAGCGPQQETHRAEAPARPQAAGVSPEAAAARPAGPAGEAAAPDLVDARLYFPDADGNLGMETRVVAREATPALQARTLVQALVSGPTGELTPALPPDSAVRALHLGADGTAYLDMNQAFENGLSAGSEDALLAVRSIVQTLTANVPEVLQVKLLIEGEETANLGGHLDLSRPFGPEGAPR